jgi:magnesium chelatase accessory protein
MLEAPDWNTDGRDWPNRASSCFIDAVGLRWHVQQMGTGPVMLLIHGTGAATHSWRDLAPLLAQHYTVVAPDLPGHGFTTAPDPQRMSLPGMAQSIAGLLDALALRPECVVGHSAGAAMLARMCLDGLIEPRRMISLNGALLPLSGLRNPLFSPLAQLFVSNPFVPRLVAWQASNPAVLDRLLGETGSSIEGRGAEFYGRLASKPRHVAAALDMMARWDVRPLEEDLPRLTAPLLLISGENDRMIPPSHARDVQRILPPAELITLPGLGHLAHEENPQLLAALLHSGNPGMLAR